MCYIEFITQCHINYNVSLFSGVDIMATKEYGIIGIFTGGLTSAAGGISMAIFASFLFALIFSSKTKKGGH